MESPEEKLKALLLRRGNVIVPSVEPPVEIETLEEINLQAFTNGDEDKFNISSNAKYQKGTSILSDGEMETDGKATKALEWSDLKKSLNSTIPRNDGDDSKKYSRTLNKGTPP